MCSGRWGDGYVYAGRGRGGGGYWVDATVPRRAFRVPRQTCVRMCLQADRGDLETSACRSHTRRVFRACLGSFQDSV